MDKKKFKMPSSFTILFLIIIVIAVLTFIVPSGEYIYQCADGSEALNYNDTYVCPADESSATQINAAIQTGDTETVTPDMYTEDAEYIYLETEQKPQGIWQMINAPTNGFYEAVDIALFVIVIGGFINVVMSTGALDSGIDALLKRFNGKEQILIPILMTLFALGGTTYGMAEETIAFYLLIVPIFYKAGYDAVTGFMVIMLGAGIGVLASTVNPFATGVASDAAGVSMGNGIVGRTILLVILVAITITFVMRYAAKVKKDPTKSVTYDLKKEHDKEFLKEAKEVKQMTGAHKVVLILFASSFVIMIMGVIPWVDFGVTIFGSINDTLSSISIFGGYDGALALGDWWFGELTTLFLVMSIIIGIIAKSTKIMEDDFIDTFITGCKDLLSVALIIGLARGIQVVMTSSGMDATLLYYGSNAMQNLSEGAFAVATFLFYLPMSFLIPSTSGLASATIPVMGPLGDMIYGSSNGSVQVITAFTAASGILNIITPTSGVVMGGLALSKIPYDRWLKFIVPFLVVISIIVIVYLFGLSLLGFYI